MDDPYTPEGQLELRLEACEWAGLTNLLVEAEPCVTVTAKWGSGDSYYSFRVSEGTSGVPTCSWNEVTTNYIGWETESGAIETTRTESNGPTRGLPELLAEHEAVTELQTFYREGFTALIGLFDVAQELIHKSVEDAAYEAARSAAERLSTHFQKPSEAPPLPCVNDDFAAFEEACRERAQHCDGIDMSWDRDFEGPPEVEFGIALNTPHQVHYKVDSDEDLYLNGFRTRMSHLEADLLEQFPSDGWARLGARNAALDLLKIQSTAQALMDAQKQDTLQDLDRRYVEDRFSLVEGTLRGTASSDHRAGVEFACKALWEKIKTHLDGLRNHPPVPDDEWDFGDLDFDLGEDIEAGDSGPAGLVNS